MKIKIEITTSKEIELPKYFKNGNDYFMIKDNESYIRVYDTDYNPSLGLYPEIKISDLNGIKHYIKDFTPVSEEEFKTAFIRVSVLIEEIFNN